MLDLTEQAAPPFTPPSGRRRPAEPHTPLLGSSIIESPEGSSAARRGQHARSDSFPVSAYRSSLVLETGSAIPLPLPSSDRPREVQIRQVRDSILSMSSVLSDMKSQLDTMRRASSGSMVAADALPATVRFHDRTASDPVTGQLSPVEPSPAPDAAVDRAAELEALGAPWMPSNQQGLFVNTHEASQSPHGPPPAFKAPLSPLSPPQFPPLLSRNTGSPADNDSYATAAEDHASDDDMYREPASKQRSSSANWRDMLSPSPTKDFTTPASRPKSMRQVALGDDEDLSINTSGPYSEGMSIDQGTPKVFGVHEAVKMRTVGPALTVNDPPTPQEAQLRFAGGAAPEIPGEQTPPVPPRHDAHGSDKRQHRSRSDGGESGASFSKRSRAQTRPLPPLNIPSLRRSATELRSEPPRQREPGTVAQRSPPSQAAAAEAQRAPRSHAHSKSQPQAQAPDQSDSRSRSHPRTSTGHGHTPSHQQSSGHHRAKTAPVKDSETQRRNFTKKSITDLVRSASPGHVYDLDDINLPGPERRLLEKFVDVLSKLSIEIQMDDGKRDEGRRRLHNALRALEGWI